MSEEKKESETAAPAKKKRSVQGSGKRMTNRQRAEAIALWRSGTVTLTELAKKYNKSTNALVMLFKKNNVKKGETADKVTEAVTRKINEKLINTDDIVVRVRDTKEEHYKIASGIAKLTWSLIVMAKKSNKPMRTILHDLRALKNAAEIFKIAREERFVSLGIKEFENLGDKPLPQLVVKELTGEDIKRIQNTRLGDSELDIDEGDIPTLSEEELSTPTVPPEGDDEGDYDDDDDEDEDDE